MIRGNQKFDGKLGDLVINFFSIIWATVIQIKNKLFTNLKLFVKNEKLKRFSEPYPKKGHRIRLILYCLLIVIPMLFGPLLMSIIVVFFAFYFEVLNYELHIFKDAKDAKKKSSNDQKYVQLENKLYSLLTFSIIVFIILAFATIIPLCKPNHKQLLFCISADFKEELNDCIISEKLRDEFANHSCPLSDNSIVMIKKEESKEWEITHGKKIIIYEVEKKLNVYEPLIGLRVLTMYGILKGMPFNVSIYGNSCWWSGNVFWGVIAFLIGGINLELFEFVKEHPSIKILKQGGKQIYT